MASAATVKPDVDRPDADLDTLVGNEVEPTTKGRFRTTRIAIQKVADRVLLPLKLPILTTRTAVLETSS